MHHASPRYNVPLLLDDMERKGWLATDLARKARVSDMTVTRFLRNEHQTPRTAKKLAGALGQKVERYHISRVEAVA